MSDTEIEIPETGHVHTPGYPEHDHRADGIRYTSETMTLADVAMFDEARHDQDIEDQAERTRLSELLGPAEIGELALANLTEHGGEVRLLETPSKDGGATLRVTHPRIASPVLIDVYYDK